MSHSKPRQFDQLAELLEQAYSLKAGRIAEGNLIDSGDGRLRSAAAIAAVLMRDIEGLSFPVLGEYLGASASEVQQVAIAMQSLMHHDPAVDHVVLRFKFALRMLRDYRPVEALKWFVMPGPFGIVAEQHET